MADIIIPKGTQSMTLADGDSVRLVEGDGLVFIDGATWLKRIECGYFFTGHVRAPSCRVDQVVILNPKTTVTTAEPQEDPQRPSPAM